MFLFAINMCFKFNVSIFANQKPTGILLNTRNQVRMQKSEQKEVVDLAGDSQKHNETPSAFSNGKDSKSEEKKDQK